MMSVNYLVIEGNIGAGKTTFARLLGEEFDARLILERFADNPFLPKFYADPEKYSFPLELSFLADRYGQLKKDLSNLDLFHQHTIADYYFMKSLIFAQNTLAQDEYNLYRNFFDIIYERLPKPGLFVYLHVPEEQLISNIRKRGREYEMSITPEYLRRIREGYFTFFTQQNDFPVLIVDTSRLDFVLHKEHYDLLRDLVTGPVGWSGIRREILVPEI